MYSHVYAVLLTGAECKSTVDKLGRKWYFLFHIFCDERSNSV